MLGKKRVIASLVFVFGSANVSLAQSDSQVRQRMAKLAQFGQDPILSISTQSKRLVECSFPSDTDGTEFLHVYLDSTIRASGSSSKGLVKSVLFRNWKESPSSVEASFGFGAADVLEIQKISDPGNLNNQRYELRLNGWRKSPAGIMEDGFYEDVLNATCSAQVCSKTNTLRKFDGLVISVGEKESNVEFKFYDFLTQSSESLIKTGECAVRF